jgi:hypothetical protein
MAVDEKSALPVTIMRLLTHNTLGKEIPHPHQKLADVSEMLTASYHQGNEETAAFHGAITQKTA